MINVTRRTAIGQRYIVHTYSAPGWARDSVLVVDTYTLRRCAYYIWRN